MVHYGHFSPKPHLGLSNSKWIGRFNCGPLRGWKAHMNQERKTTVVYSRDGKKKWHGSKHLKSTQSTPQLNVLWVAYCTQPFYYVNSSWICFSHCIQSPQVISLEIWTSNWWFDATLPGRLCGDATLPQWANWERHFSVFGFSLG